MTVLDLLIARPEGHLGHRAGWLRAAVLGANDGLVSTSSLMVGVAAASNTQPGAVLQVVTRGCVSTPVPALGWGAPSAGLQVATRRRAAAPVPARAAPRP